MSSLSMQRFLHRNHLPAPLAWIIHLYTHLKRRKAEWRYRRQLRLLLDYDHVMLDDMGYTRAELEMAIDLPMDQEAAQALLYWKNERRRTG